MSEFLEAARAYLAAGLRPIPCQPAGKAALVPWKEYQDRPPRPEELEQWWGGCPDANVALVLGRGMFAVDIDSAEGRANLERAGVELPPDAPSVVTGKGAHVYLAGDARDRVGLVPGVDIRGVGYVIAPPSVHPSGQRYAWAVGFRTPLPPAPPALLALLQRHAPQPAAGDWAAQALAGVAEGGRDDACTRLAGYLLGKGVSVEATEAVLQGWATRCIPPFPPDQVTKCVRSIAAREGAAAPDGPPPCAADLVGPTLELISRPVRNTRQTGLATLDVLLEGGLEPGTITLLGGRPGTGKTALMLQIARHVARAGTGVLFVTLEMGATRLMRRLFSQVSQVRFQHLRSGAISDGERAALELAAEHIRTLPLWIETRVRTAEALDALLDQMGGSVGLVVIDYLQKMSSPNSGDSMREAVEHVSRALCKIAVGRDLPLLAAASLSRPDRATASWRPSLLNLRESGVLEHDADNVILLFRDPDSDVLEVDLAKQRDGAVGKTALRFVGETLTFKERV